VNRERTLATAAGLAIYAYFLSLAGAGISAGFSHDDLSNLYHYWVQPPGRLLIGSLLPFTQVYRPLAALFYRPVYALGGFDPFPFHAVLFALLTLNLFLLYAFARRMAGSRVVALAALFLASFHAALSSIYYDTGMVYDVLCFSFFFGALLLYLRVRQSGRRLSALHLAALLALDLAALDAKEMAATLPVLLAAYEWWWERRRDWRGTILSSLLTVIFAASRAVGAASLVANPNYKPTVRLSALFHSLGRYWGMLFYSGRDLAVPVVLLVAAALVAVAWWRRDRVLKFSAVWALVTLLPVAFITPRPGFVLYLPIAGWALYAAALIGARGRVMAVLLPVLAVVLWPVHARYRDREIAVTVRAQQSIREAAAKLASLHLKVKPDTTILVLRDPFPDDPWSALYILKLQLGEPAVPVFMGRQFKAPPKIEAFNLVLDYQDGFFRGVR
jgi:hypothetical protein